MKKTLIIVDEQNDFCSKNGSLYVDGGKETVDEIFKFIFDHADELAEVVFTLDWHPLVENAYKEDNTTWPWHCTQHTEGAAIPDELLKACRAKNLPVKFFLKGNSTEDNHTEYGAFEACQGITADGKLILSNRVGDSTVIFESNTLVVCGLAGDYCVKNTIKNLLEYQNANDEPFDIEVFMKGIASIDGGEALNKFIEENKLKTV